MAIGGVFSFSPFGSYADIKKQAEAIKERVSKETEARKAEQERTGLIQNKDGDMVELSSLSEKEIEHLNNWAEMKSLSKKEVAILFAAADPNAEAIEEDQKRAAVFRKLQNKMFAGKRLTGEEKSFLREHYPEFAAKAEEAERLSEELKAKLSSCKSKDDERRIYLGMKMSVMNNANMKDGSILFMTAALDNAYAEHNGRNNPSANLLDIFA